MNSLESGSILQIPEGSLDEYKKAVEMIQGHYQGAKAAVFMDKDETILSPDAETPSDPRLKEIIGQAQKSRILSGIDSNSSPFDLIKLGRFLGMGGLHIAERGAVICGFPDKSEICLVGGGEWLNKKLPLEILRLIRDDSYLDRNILVIFGDPWAIIHAQAKLPGSKSKVVMFNSGRRASFGMVTGLLGEDGRIIRSTEESLAFFVQIADLYKEAKERLLSKEPFPDSEGMHEDVSSRYEVVNVVSLASDKRRAMDFISRILGIPIFHIGDSKQDDMRGIERVETLAVGNNTLKDEKGVIAAPSTTSMAESVVWLYENHILPLF